MELRLAAALAKDENMIQAFIKGEDLHDYTAEKMGCDRQIAKSANFGLLYGAGAEGLRNYAGSSGVLMTLEEAKTVRDNWLRTYKGVHAWQNKNYQIAKNSNGNEWAETRIPLSNMRRYLKGDLNRVTVRCNTPIQGTAAAILTLSSPHSLTSVHKFPNAHFSMAAPAPWIGVLHLTVTLLRSPLRYLRIFDKGIRVSAHSLPLEFFAI
jgi:DNA polymerase I-like protein with 3'-5' exonuclease and polymerase domains